MNILVLHSAIKWWVWRFASVNLGYWVRIWITLSTIFVFLCVLVFAYFPGNGTRNASKEALRTLKLEFIISVKLSGLKKRNISHGFHQIFQIHIHLNWFIEICGRSDTYSEIQEHTDDTQPTVKQWPLTRFHTRPGAAEWLLSHLAAQNGNLHSRNRTFPTGETPTCTVVLTVI